MDLLPLVLKRLVNGPPETLPETDSVELFFENNGSRNPATFEQIVAMYALSFVHVGCKEMAIKFLQTVMSMPTTKMTNYVGLTKDMVLSLLTIAKCVPEKSPALITHLTQIANGPYYNATKVLKIVDYKAKLADDIIEYMSTGQVKLAVLTTNLLASLSRKLNFFAGFAILQRLEKVSEALAYEWLGGAISSVRKIAVDELINWCIRRTVNDRSHFMDQFQVVTRRSPLHAIRLLSYMNRAMYDYEADRKYLLAKAFIDVSESKDTKAMCRFFVLVARGPKSPIRSYRGHQSLFQRTHMVVQFLKRIDTTIIDVTRMTHSLLFVSSLLRSQEADRLIWREMLRIGIEPDTTHIHTSLRPRLVCRSDIRQSAELMAILIRQFKPDDVQNADFDDESAVFVDEDEFAKSSDSTESEELAPKNKALLDFSTPNMEISTRRSRKIYITLLDGLNHAGIHEL
ncbi:hypothetical protein IW150_006796, partial [Coemansia sp. RSA 2607]